MSNKGIFSPKDTKFLMDMQQFPTFGQLELIENQSGTTITSIDFTNIKQNIYNVHLLVMNNFQTVNDNVEVFRVRVREKGGSFYTTQYKTAFYRGRTNGTFTEYRSNNTIRMYMNQNGGNASYEKSAGFVYFYNLGNKTKLSNFTHQSIVTQNDGVHNITYGSATLNQQSECDAIRIITSSGDFSSYNASLYGIRFTK